MNKELLLKEVVFKAVRSSGSGGQNVNKVSSKVELYFSVNNSEGLSSEEKERISNKLSNRISKDGFLILNSQEDRSQLVNKEIVSEKFFDLLERSLKQEKPRRATKPSKASKLKRLLDKKIHSAKKQNRTKDF